MDPNISNPNITPPVISPVVNPPPAQAPVTDTPQIQQPVTPQQEPSPPKKKSKILLFILIPVLILILIGAVVFAYLAGRVNSARQAALEAVDNADLEITESPSPESECTPLSYGLKRSTVATLALQETESRGYEGLVRKSTDGEEMVFMVVTNKLPDSGTPYSVWVAYPDTKGRICGGVFLGEMGKDSSSGFWTVSFDDSIYKDDANVILITSGNPDTDDGSLDSMDDPHVILRGFFAQTDNVRETDK